MSLARTATTVRLKSDDGLYYDVRLPSAGGIPEPDETTGASGTSDEYVAFLGDDGNVYRWSLESRGGLIGNLVELSETQSEDSVAGIDLKYGESWYRVSVEMSPDAGGVMIPLLVVGPGEEWSGGFVRPFIVFPTWNDPVSTLATWTARLQ